MLSTPLLFLQYYSAVRAARSCRDYYSNADVIKLLRCDRSSDTRALLFYFILFYFILFYFILFYFILFYFILFYFILFYFILFYFILFYFILFYFILFYFILFYFILFYFCETPRTVHRQSPTQPALFAEVRTLPIFQHFSSKSLSFNMAHLGGNVSDNIRCDVINSYLLTWRI